MPSIDRTKTTIINISQIFRKLFYGSEFGHNIFDRPKRKRSQRQNLETKQRKILLKTTLAHSNLIVKVVWVCAFLSFDTFDKL